jgi:CRP-like cAMP-binding protein
LRLNLPAGNRIIDAVVAHETADVFARARVVRLDRSQFTTLQDTTMSTVDFPTSALLSVVGSAEDGATCELAAVGTEAFVEIDAALRNDVAKRTAMCLLEGEVIRVPLADFQRGLTEAPDFGDRVYRAVRARAFTTEQLVMCNVRHTVVQRLARWLLVAHERVLRSDFPVTHEFLAAMLGTRRASVTEATASLVDRGAIANRRNSIEIVDGAALAAAACECYAVCRGAIEESIA